MNVTGARVETFAKGTIGVGGGAFDWFSLGKRLQMLLLEMMGITALVSR